MTFSTDKIIINLERYEELIVAEAELNALYAAGVDNWDGFDEAMELVREGAL